MFEGVQGAMFLFRSAFWLILAFLVVRPTQMDFSQAAQAAAEAGLSAGRSAAIAGVEALPCDRLECVGAKLTARSFLGSDSEKVAKIAPETMHLPPFPRPRIARSG